MIPQAVLVLLALHSSSPQLIGHRGVITLREGVEYRDPETVEASETVAHFAKEFQEIDDEIAERNSRTNTFRSRLNEVSPKFQTQVLENVRGRPLVENEIFDFLESRFVEPPQELQFNKFLDEVEIERATSPVRLLPGEGLAPTPAPPTRAPNRLVNLQRPSLGSQESVRSQNSQFATVFGPPTNNNAVRLGANLAQNNFLDSNQLVDSLPSAGFNAVPPSLNIPAAALAQDAVAPHVIRPFVNLNAGSMYLSEPEPVTHQIPHQPVFGTAAVSQPGFSNSQLGSGPPLIQDIGPSFHQEAGLSHGSFHQDIGLSLGQLSDLPPAPQELSTSYGPPVAPPLHAVPGPGPHYPGHHLTSSAGFPPEPAQQLFGASPEFNQPFVTSLAAGGGARISQITGGPQHSFSSGPHHSLSIQHLH